MSYTPTNWQTGDTITAEKMNNIEQGIVNAPKVAVVNISTEGFGSASHNFGYIFYATWDGEEWHPINDDTDSWYHIWGYTEPNWRTLPPLIIPEGDNVGLFYWDSSFGAFHLTFTGDISTSYIDVRFNYGSIISPCYRISGSGAIHILAD